MIPPVYFHDFWLFKSDMQPINETTPALPLHLEFKPLSIWRWSLMLQMDEQFAVQRSMGAAGENEAETFKRMFVETNPYLLGVTMVVSLLHTVFDVLAFKNGPCVLVAGERRR